MTFINSRGQPIKILFIAYLILVVKRVSFIGLSIISREEIHF